MVQRRITLPDLVFDAPLPWDLFSRDGRVLLRKGQVLANRAHGASLVADGLFADPDQGAGAADASTLRLLNGAGKRLERLLFALSGKTDAQAEVSEIAASVIAAADLNPDVALASILLNQIGGLYAIRHCIESAVVAVLVARAQDQPAARIASIAAATLTMNVGMLRHHEQLQSQRASLSPEEMSVIRRHPEDGAHLLKQAGVDDADWLSWVLLHHENDDGSGYPFGKGGADIPPNAKLIALADRYCAAVSARNYRTSVLPDKALRDLVGAPRNAVDPELARAFAAQLGAYPPGSFVRLRNGEIGVVSRRAQGARAATVHALIGAGGAPLLPFPIERDTGQPPFDISAALPGDEVGIRFAMKQIWGAHAAL